MFMGCHHFQLNSQALRSSQDDLWAICWQCPSVLCPFALWSSPFVFQPPVFHLLTLCLFFVFFALTFSHLCHCCPGSKWIKMESTTNVSFTGWVEASINSSKNINWKREGHGCYCGCITAAWTERQNRFPGSKRHPIRTLLTFWSKRSPLLLDMI